MTFWDLQNRPHLRMRSRENAGKHIAKVYLACGYDLTIVLTMVHAAVKDVGSQSGSQ